MKINLICTVDILLGRAYIFVIKLTKAELNGSATPYIYKLYCPGYSKNKEINVYFTILVVLEKRD